MFPIEFCGTYSAGDRLPPALRLLHRLGVRPRADKLPSALSGGAQQRAAIAPHLFERFFRVDARGPLTPGT